MERKFIKGIIETLLFITDKPLNKEKILELIDDKNVTGDMVVEIIKELSTDYIKNSAIELREVAGGYQFATRAEYSEYVRRLYRDRTLLRLSPSSLETLAIIAYRQPITKAEIEETRGVDSTSVIETLLERKLIKIIGRKEIPGRPLLYGTTQDFLKQFGLNSLVDLPPIDQFLNENQEQFPVGDEQSEITNLQDNGFNNLEKNVVEVVEEHNIPKKDENDLSKDSH
ncbi:MAG: SMC-Scp complex subunit ScpB [Endomicrobiia bacterium]